MPRLNLDLTEAQVFEAPPAGTWLCRIDQVGDVKKGPKARYVAVRFVVVEPPHENKSGFRNYPIEGPGAGFFIDLANKAIDAGLEPGPKIDFDTDDLIGAEVRVVFEEEEYPEGSGDFRVQPSRVLSAD